MTSESSNLDPLEPSDRASNLRSALFPLGVPGIAIDGEDEGEMEPTLLNPLMPVEESDDLPTIVLPMQLAGLDAAARTDVGRQRVHNEDFFGITLQSEQLEYPLGATVQAKGLYILCDGMGGHAGGEVASRLAVEAIQSYFREHWYDRSDWQLPTVEAIEASIHSANQVLYEQNQAGDRLGSARMGTTLVMLLVCGTKVAVAHVGDSRLYMLTRKLGLQQWTIDHEVGQREIQRGADPTEAYARPDAYQLTQALGPRENEYVQPDIQVFDLIEDAVFLLASDGLTDNDLLEQYWPSYLEPLLSSQMTLEQGVQNLIDLGNQYNGYDNVSAIVVRLKVRPDVLQFRV
jgi:protein phosphatase